MGLKESRNSSRSPFIVEFVTPQVCGLVATFCLRAGMARVIYISTDSTYKSLISTLSCLAQECCQRHICNSVTYSLQSRRLSSRSDHADRRASTLITYGFGYCFTVSGLSQATLQDCLKTLKKNVSSPDFDIISFPPIPHKPHSPYDSPCLS